MAEQEKFAEPPPPYSLAAATPDMVPAVAVLPTQVQQINYQPAQTTGTI